MLRCSFLFLVSFIFFIAPAQAAWHEASSEHFVIYADQKASSLQDFAQRLEKYHAGMAYMLGREPETPSKSNRVTIFVVDSTSAVRKVTNHKNRNVAGVYRPNAGNIVAVVPRLRSVGNKFALSPEVILRHEYAHHFMFNISARAFPLWFQEGFAEFFASGREERDGTMILGGVANHRAYELAASREVPIEILLDTDRYLENKSSRYDQFYGRSWLLYHMLSFDESRKDQFGKFQKLIANGSSDIDAAREAFGDLDKLDKDLDRYAGKKRLKAIGLAPATLKTKPVQMRKLSKGADAMMPVIIESRTGVTEEQARELIVDARKIAAEYPDDAMVQEALAEAEYDAGYDAQALAAADKALALDPKRIRAQLQKIYVANRNARTSGSTNDAWNNVRKEIVAANRIENNNPIPLIQYYRSYKDQGVEVPDLAVDGLARALQLAPYDASVRLMMTAQYMETEKYQLAAATISPLAYNPHRSAMTDAALQLLELAQSKIAEDKEKSETISSGF